MLAFTFALCDLYLCNVCTFQFRQNRSDLNKMLHSLARTLAIPNTDVEDTIFTRYDATEHEQSCYKHGNVIYMEYYSCCFRQKCARIQHRTNKNCTHMRLASLHIHRTCKSLGQCLFIFFFVFFFQFLRSFFHIRLSQMCECVWLSVYTLCTYMHARFYCEQTFFRLVHYLLFFPLISSNSWYFYTKNHRTVISPCKNDEE